MSELKFIPIYESFDLGAYDERFKGQTIRLLMNPSRRFRREFLQAKGQSFIEYLAVALDVKTPDEASAILDDLDIEVHQWLFIGVFLNGEITWPHIMSVWDDWVSKRVKGWAANSAEQNGTSGQLESEKTSQDG